MKRKNEKANSLTYELRMYLTKLNLLKIVLKRSAASSLEALLMLVVC